MTPISYGQPLGTGGAPGSAIPGYSSGVSYATPTRVGGDIWNTGVNPGAAQGAAATAAATNPQIGRAPDQLYNAYQDLTGNPLSLRSSPLYNAQREQAMKANDRMLAASRMSKSGNALYSRAGVEQDVMAGTLAQLGQAYGAGAQQEYGNWNAGQSAMLNDQALRLQAVLGGGDLANQFSNNVIGAQKADIARSVGTTGAPVLGQLGIGPNTTNDWQGLRY